MRSFQDQSGQEWRININGYTLKRVLQSSLKADLGDPTGGDPPLLTRFAVDIIFQVDLLYLICQPQCEELEMDDIAFAQILEGDVLKNAHFAFMEEWADFFQKLGQNHKAKVILTQLKLVEDAIRLACDVLESEPFAEKQRETMAALSKSFSDSLDL